eukprot:CAMPEP_0169244206 /NCGR_PEP_ID=MMETSP1016-20121227/33512_1 /TAXON_ID=342587 /ORGANISM="Karlodinium micrum, Strain CCMP2283" /LENGTH=323 /DNA_ID=CAMNT_0009324573 /DNA_START=68 /DNA_END=1039 /DNA_ORIENTATION=-
MVSQGERLDLHRCDAVASSSSSPHSNSVSASLTSVTDAGALMLPEPYPEDSPVVLVPALQIAAESLAVEQSRAKKKELGVDIETVGLEPVPAMLTPRGSIVALEAVPAVATCNQVARMGSNESVRAGDSHDRNEQSGFRARAEAAEKEVRKLRMEVTQLEGQVRKLRSDAYFQRIQKNLHPRVVSDKGLEGDAAVGGRDEHEASLSKALAEERALNAETEALRLHAELQAARIQFTLLSEQTTSSAPPPEDCAKVDSVDYAIIPCLRYVCGCIYFYWVRIFMAVCCCCFCFRVGRPRENDCDLENPKEKTLDVSIKAFCADRA